LIPEVATGGTLRIAATASAVAGILARERSDGTVASLVARHYTRATAYPVECVA
jgi:hypothetical protein